MSGARTVLLVDDDEAVRTTLGLMLEDVGFRVVECGSLREARLAIATRTDVCLALLDAKLPDGLGTSLVKVVRATFPKAAIVVLSGDAPSLDDPVDRVVLKAGDPASLLATIEDLSREAR